MPECFAFFLIACLCLTSPALADPAVQNPTAETVSTVTDPAPSQACPAIRFRYGIREFRPNPGKPKHAQIPGILVRMTTGADITARIYPRFWYVTGSWVRKANLRPRTIRVNGSRRLLFAVPAEKKDRLRDKTGHVYGHRVAFGITTKLKARGAPDNCFQHIGTPTLRARIIGVSVRSVFRRLPLPDLNGPVGTR